MRNDVPLRFGDRAERMMGALFRDLRHVLRRARRAPGFTAAVVLTLALGIGATTAVFSLVDAVLLRPLPYPDSDRLVALRHATPGLEVEDVGHSSGTYLHYRENNRVFEEMALYHEATVNLSGGGEPERIRITLATPSLFRILGAEPAVGRLLDADDARPGSPSVVILAHDLWTRRYGGDPGIVGRTVTVNEVPRRVAGVAPPGFHFPDPRTDLWLSVAPNPSSARFGDPFRESVARLRPGVDTESAEADLRRLLPSMAAALPDLTPEMLRTTGLRPVVRPLKASVVGDVGPVLWIVLGTVAFVLLIAWGNVANLFLVRAESRGREVAVRRALGAERSDLARGFLAESGVFGLAGGAAGAGLAAAGIRALLALAPPDIPRLHEVGLDARALAFTAGLSVAASLVFGAVSLLRFRRDRTEAALRAGRGEVGSGATRTRQLLIAGQVALALALVAGSALLGRSFLELRAVDPGFRAAGDVLTVDLALPFRRYEEYSGAAGFYRSLLDRLRALPGVEAAGAASSLPLTGETFTELRSGLVVEGRDPGPDAALPIVEVKLVTPGYFEAMGIPLRAGRRFGPRERPEGRPVLVSEPLAERLLGSRTVGRRVRRDGEEAWSTVAGVVGGVRDASVRSPPTEVLYVPMLEGAEGLPFVPRVMSLAIRTSVPPGSLVPAVRRAVGELDPAIPVAGVGTVAGIVAASTARTSFTALLLTVAAVVALVLGTVGIYGVISWAVSRHTREIGLRMALGATARDVARWALGRGLPAVGGGLAAGLLAALLLTRLLEGLLFRVQATDPPTLGLAVLVLLVVALAAGGVPARRAARIDPAEALRHE